jgi:methenyltetrahydrofolate cyclohydrolase
MSSLWDLNLTQLQQRVSSLDPTPGGGSISVMNAVFGLSLVQKGIRVSLKKIAGNSSSQEELSALEIRAVSAMEPLRRYVDADTDAFQGYIRASGLPRATEEERATRKRVMEEALLHSSRIPMEAVSQMNLCLGIAESAIRLAKQSVLSDIAAGALLIRASIQAILLNVDSNLAGISDSFMRKELSERRKQLETAMLPCIETVLQEFQRRVTASG